MEFEWDEAKDAINIAKHGVTLGEAVRLDWLEGVTRADERNDYGEVRRILNSKIQGRLYVCTYTRRGNRRRIISLRKANKREILTYG